MINLPKISIITVVYNDVAHIEQTIRSVIGQDYPAIEYIIIDGDSTDGTREVIKKFEKQIHYWLSEPDKGLYDAMNKGLRKAGGDYVCFLNSGDRLYQSNVLRQVFGAMEPPYPDVVYGETMITGNDGCEIGLRRLRAPDSLTWKSLRDGMLVCHQSFFASRNLAPEYDERFRFAADYDWMLKILRKAHTIHNARCILSSFLDGGVSKKNIRKGLTERFFIMVKNFGFFPTFFRHFLIAVRFFSFLIKNQRF